MEHLRYIYLYLVDCCVSYGKCDYIPYMDPNDPMGFATGAGFFSIKSSENHEPFDDPCFFKGV